MVVTDHKGLESLRSAPQRNRRLHHWVLSRSEFDFEIQYRLGEQNVVADRLSKCFMDAEEDTLQMRQGGWEDVGVASQPT